MDGAAPAAAEEGDGLQARLVSQYVALFQGVIHAYNTQHHENSDRAPRTYLLHRQLLCLRSPRRIIT